MTPTEKPGRFLAPPQWQSDIFLTNPLFNDLALRFPLADCRQFPDCRQLTQWLHQQTGLTDWRFVDQSVLEQDGRYYEDFIFDTRQIPLRANNWHDLFGALIWCLFPATKQQINRLHRTELQAHGQKVRSKIRHKLTLLDECGVVLCLTPEQAELAQWLRQHQWQKAFYQQRDLWTQLKPMIFGHANYEMATRPFIGLTAKLWLLEIDADRQQEFDTERYSFVDELLAKQLAKPEQLLNHQQLSPLPLLGVPGWFAGQDLAFYQDTSYFRPKRQQTEQGVS
ncbi:DUF3025 domain-containing protein [Rheinheimera sp.]|uniref:DUF3025 domain-containing protein n=1 Tax=Rheinheimera sp. TaxID=1869214 RepID=UPI00307E7707